MATAISVIFISETATEALVLVAILPLQLNECLQVACGLCLDVILLPVLGNLIPLSLALLHQVEGKVAIVLTCLGSSVGKR